MVEQPAAPRARNIAVVVTWAVWLSALCVGLFWHASSFCVAGLFLIGFVPYLLSIHFIEPWLAKRGER